MLTRKSLSDIEEDFAEVFGGLLGDLAGDLLSAFAGDFLIDFAGEFFDVKGLSIGSVRGTVKIKSHDKMLFKACVYLHLYSKNRKLNF